MELPLVLNDTDVATFADMRELVNVLKEFFRIGANGSLMAPPRHSVDFGSSGKLVFTIGGLSAPGSEGFAGFRVYDTFGLGGSASAQLVAVWRLPAGKLEGLILGSLLGAMRTGAIGGVAIDALSRPDVQRCGIIGSGLQAETQLKAAMAVRPGIEYIAVFSRSVDKRESFARRMAQAISRPVHAVASARGATEGADLLICATDSSAPVVESEWLAPGLHINTIGSRLTGAHELPISIGAKAAICATDSLVQIRSLPQRHFLADTPAGRDMIELSHLVAGNGPTRKPSDITLFCSVGISGSEIAAGSAVIEKCRQHRLQQGGSGDTGPLQTNLN